MNSTEKKKVHLIAIGGAIMHQIALSLHRQGHIVTGSDDVIQEPSKSRLEAAGLMPERLGFYAENIATDLDLIVLGMHARLDNIELTRAMEQGIRVLSFPELIYESSKEKKRVVIAGSHGKTSITSMIMHCLREANWKFDYAVGSSVQGFDYSVQLTDAPIIIIEGDEYLASALNKEPKFIYYHGDLAVLSGIEWDHINVFKTEEIYREQFRKLIRSMQPAATLFYFNDPVVHDTIQDVRTDIVLEPYQAIPYKVKDEVFSAVVGDQVIELQLFGKHNMENVEAARRICIALGMPEMEFWMAIASFGGAGRRLETIVKSEQKVVYKDFAHSPSKLRATVHAVREKHPDAYLIACFELHTFSSLSAEFLSQYANTMDLADKAIVYIDQSVVEQKGNAIFTKEQIHNGFQNDQIVYCTDKASLDTNLGEHTSERPVYLMMSSGTFSGIDWSHIGDSPQSPETSAAKTNLEINTNQISGLDRSKNSSHTLSESARTNIRIMLSLTYIGWVIAAGIWYAFHRQTKDDVYYNAMVEVLNYQIVASIVLIIGMIIPIWSFAILPIIIGIHMYITYRAINRLNFHQVLGLDSGMRLILPRKKGN